MSEEISKVKQIPAWSKEAIALYNCALKKAYMQLAFELFVFVGLCFVIHSTNNPTACLVAAVALVKVYFTADNLHLLKVGNKNYLSVVEFEELK